MTGMARMTTGMARMTTGMANVLKRRFCWKLSFWSCLYPSFDVGNIPDPGVQVGQVGVQLLPPRQLVRAVPQVHEHVN